MEASNTRWALLLILVRDGPLGAGPLDPVATAGTDPDLSSDIKFDGTRARVLGATEVRAVVILNEIHFDQSFCC